MPTAYFAEREARHHLDARRIVSVRPFAGTAKVMRLPSLLGVASVLHSPVPQLNHRFPAPVSVSSGSAREVFLALLSQRAVQTQLCAKHSSLHLTMCR